jgi:hypothetical protein
MAYSRFGNAGVGGRPMKRALSFFGALAVFAALVALGSEQRVPVAEAAGGDSCANAALRNGASAYLSDCRAYELVSPVDKNGGDIVSRCTARCVRTSLMQSTPDGEKLSYSSYIAFGDAASSLYSNQYIASRGPDGWSTHAINAPRESALYGGGGLPGSSANFFDINIETKALSGDLSRAVVTDASIPALTPDAPEGFPSLYSRDNNADSYDWIAALASEPFQPVFPEVWAVSETGDHVVFGATRPLTPDALPGEGLQLYDYSGGELHLVSVLPDGTPVAPAAAGEGASQEEPGEEQEGKLVDNSLSRDGRRITWTLNPFTRQNIIYQRIDNSETKQVSRITAKSTIEEVVVAADGGSFKLNLETEDESETTGAIAENASALEVQEALEELGIVEPGDVTVTGTLGGPYTLTFAGRLERRHITTHGDGAELTGSGAEVSVNIIQSGTGSAYYQGANVDGTEVLYRQQQGPDNTLYRADVDGGTAIAIAKDVQGLVGASDDLSYIYFVSEEVLDSGATASEPNLYLFHQGSVRFITTLSWIDAGRATFIFNEEGSPSVAGYSVIADTPQFQAARVTPDGLGLAFQSVASLTGYDNRDIKNNEPDVEVYVYDAASDELVCASCNPTGARPNGKPLILYDDADENPKLNNNTAARRWTAAFLQTVENHTYYPHDLSDDGNRVFFNVHEGLVPNDTNNRQDVYEWEAQGTGGCTESGGCISLISSGESSYKSEFVDAGANGRDVFFTTRSSLVPQDPGLIDVYDAREGGGVAIPVPSPACEGDACQPLPVPPNDPTPASASYNGAGNVKGKARKPHRRRHKRHHKKHRKHGKHKGTLHSRSGRGATHGAGR